MCLSGNVDPLVTLQRGTTDDVRREVRRIVEHVGRQGGHVMNSGEMVPRDTPDENVHAFVQQAREAWGQIYKFEPPML